MGSLRVLGALWVVAWVGTSCARPTPKVDPSGEWNVRWDRGFSGWAPAIVNGRLSVQRGPSWNAQLTFQQSGMTFELESMSVNADHVEFVFGARTEADGSSGPAEVDVSGWIREDRLIGEARWGKDIPWTPLGGRRIPGAELVKPELITGAVDHSLPHADPAQTGFDPVGLRVLLEHAKEERSSAIVILKDGKIGTEVYRDGYDGGPLAAMSASKSIVSIAVGMLVAENKLSLDTRMGDLLPDWKDLGPKSEITVRQLVTHTSGLEPSRVDFEGKETIRAHAAAAKLLFPPGTRFQYNNGAVDFLSVVVMQAAGIPLDEFLDRHLFRKIDAVGAHWWKDPEGAPHGAGELFIRPVDLAKIGQMMLDDGAWKGEQLVPVEWVRQSVEAGQPFEEDCGLLWWREGAFSPVVNEAVLAGFQDLGIDEDDLRAARGLVGKTFGGFQGFNTAMAAALSPAALKRVNDAVTQGDHEPYFGMKSTGDVRGFSARGSLGQFLVVLPRVRTVGVRMRAQERKDNKEFGPETDGYEGFRDDLVWLSHEAK